MIKYLIILLLILFGLVHGDKMMEMPELLNPTSMVMDSQGIYIADGTTVKIYSLEKSQFINKIGKKGEGPGEFIVAPNLPITINLYNDNLYVSSLGKISIFTREGVFKKEIRNQTLAINLIPCSNKFLGKGFAQNQGKLFFTVNIYDGQIKKIKEIYREESGFWRGSNQKFDPIDATGPAIAAHSNFLFLNEGTNRNTITVYDLDGKKLFSTTHKFKEIKLTEEHKKRYMDYLETDPDFRDFVARTKHLFQFKDLFPLMQYFFIDEKKIYVVSYENPHGKRDLYVFNLKGQFLKEMEVPLVSQNVDNPYPFTFYKGKLYQIVENVDEEKWELFEYSVDGLEP